MQDVKKDRNLYIGGSDVSVILGISPFRTRWELLQEKAGLIENDFEGNCYTEYGNIMEEKIRNYINEFETDKFVEGKHINEDIRCHTDGENKTTILEIKTTSQIKKEVNDYKIYLVQLLLYMNETKRKKGKLAVYERPEDFNEEFDSDRLYIYDIELKDYKELINDIYEAIEQFRIDLLKLKENPFLTEEELEPKDLLILTKELEDIELHLKDYNSLVSRQKQLKNDIYNKMLEYKRKGFKTFGGKITLVYATEDKEIQVFDEDKFKEENPELYEKYLTNKIQKGKSGFIKYTSK